MADFGKQILAVLSEIKGNGSFICHGVQSFLFPGMQIRNADEIGFPINTIQIKELIKAAHKAPFGKGSKTVLDTNVRSVWEIDASEIKFNSKDWGKFVAGIVEQIKPDLGLEGFSVSANLYKLLIYEKGDFFVAHKDSEKEPGMFGTLIIGLPSRHTGGELSVRFDGREETIDFSEPASQYQIPFAAFYADCEHEIKPILSGYRVCLVYNLVQHAKKKVQMNSLGSQINKLAAILQAHEEDLDIPKIVLLGHQYTPTNFTMEALKLNDRPKAATLIRAAGIAGYYVKLGLVTSYQIGELEMDSGKKTSRYGYRRSYYDDYDDENLEDGTMGEVYDSHINVEHWMEQGVPPLRNIEFGEMDLISPIALHEDEPIEKSAEGYTGNAGMEMQYWYHYGAVFLWPKKYQYDMLVALDTTNKLEWIAYYNRHWNSLEKTDIEITKKLVGAGLFGINPNEKTDFTPLADWLINLNDEKYLSKKGSTFLTDHFTHISTESWIKLFETFPCNHFESIFAAVAKKEESLIIKHLVVILNKLLFHNIGLYGKFVMGQVEQLPTYLNALNLSALKEHVNTKEILRNVLEINNRKPKDNTTWIKNTTAAFTKALSREYVNDVLMVVLLEFSNKTELARQIMVVCKDDLKRRVHNQPIPPLNWSRPVPKGVGGKLKVWNILSDFLKSPDQKVFDYKSIQADRTEMEYIIRHETINLKMETIRKGSPHILRLIKTQDAYLRAMDKWKADVEWLNKLENWK